MKKTLMFLLAAAAGISMLFSGCISSAQIVDEKNMKLVQLDAPADGQEMAVIKTSAGEIKMVLYPDYAPNICKNFKERVAEGYYNNKKVFGVMKDIAFMAGADDDTGKSGKTSDGKMIKNEYHDNLWPFAGAVCAFSQKSGKCDSRFFLTTDCAVSDEMVEQMKKGNYPEAVIKAFQEKGGVPNFSRNYPVFGQVIEGMDVVKEISSYAENMDSQIPTKDIMIESITLTTYQAPKDAASETTSDKNGGSKTESKTESKAENKAESK